MNSSPTITSGRHHRPAAPDCAFCLIVTGQAPAEIIREWPDALAIRPRSGGVAADHVLVLPRVHVQDAGTDPVVTGAVMHRAAQLMAEHEAANLITSRGSASTQTVFHLHVHVVPRVPDDGLPLPWTPQHAARAAVRAAIEAAGAGSLGEAVATDEAVAA
jgi:histidine triad (HIT) family protein